MTEPLCITNNPPDYDRLVREAVDADEQHGDVRGIKYAILAVAQAIHDRPELIVQADDVSISKREAA